MEDPLEEYRYPIITSFRVIGAKEDDNPGAQEKGGLKYAGRPG
jgi:hypothetical protein